jgi:hypothetical protein
MKELLQEIDDELALLEDNSIQGERITKLRGRLDKVLFNNFISVSDVLWRIKYLEEEIEDEDSVYSEVSCRIRIDELKHILKWKK